MATRVIMPALGMAQETGKILRWLKREGEPVNQGEPLAEIETDKATVELEAPASGLLSVITAREGEDIPVGQQIALILAPGNQPVAEPAPAAAAAAPRQPAEHEQQPREERGAGEPGRPAAASSSTSTSSLTVEPPSPALMDEHTRGLGRLVSPLAARIAAEHQVDLRQLQPQGRRIQKADVLAYLASRRMQEPGESERLAVSVGQKPMVHGSVARSSGQRRLLAASPKARRLAAELGQDLAALARTGLGSGPEGAILAADVLAAASVQAERRRPPAREDGDFPPETGEPRRFCREASRKEDDMKSFRLFITTTVLLVLILTGCSAARTLAAAPAHRMGCRQRVSRSSSVAPLA